MTSQPAKPQFTLDRTTLESMIRTTVDALPHGPHAPVEAKTNRCEAAMIAMRALQPGDPMQAMLAARIVASHYAAMNDFRCAAQGDLPPALQLRYHGMAIRLSKLAEAASRELAARQSRPALQPAAPAPAPHAQAASAAAAQPSQPAPQPPAARAETPPAAAPQQQATKPAPTLRQEAFAARLRAGVSTLPCPAAQAPLASAEAMRERVLDGIAARPLAPATARAA